MAVRTTFKESAYQKHKEREEFGGFDHKFYHHKGRKGGRACHHTNFYKCISYNAGKFHFTSFLNCICGYHKNPFVGKGIFKAKVMRGLETLFRYWLLHIQ